MRNASEIQHYLNAQERIAGWFYSGDMLAFAYLGEIQEESRMEGHLCEVGVYHGKSLALLCLMRGEREQVFGFDLFSEQFLDETRKNLRNFCKHEDAAVLVKKDVMDCDEAFLRTVVPGAVRFLHVDADHRYMPTLVALRNFAKLVDGPGIIAIDDYYDRKFPGVASAAHTFMDEQGPMGFVPFLVGANKL